MSEDHEYTPVLIVGGGPGGLTASLLLSRLGIRSILVERREGTSELPKAHILNQRTMEIFDVCGVADAVYEQGSPIEFMRRVAWYTSLTGPTELHGREIRTAPVVGGRSRRARIRARQPLPADQPAADAIGTDLAVSRGGEGHGPSPIRS